MKPYLVDINIISYLADTESPFHENVRRRFKMLHEDDVVTLSILGLYELQYGISKAGEADISPGILKTKKKVCASLPVVPLSMEGAEIFGEVKTRYQKAFRLQKNALALARDTADLLIASSAIETGAIMVSHDQIFRKIAQIQPDFEVEDWAV
ncbi:MAG: type II toxin-antitoxin system VapC family toxin [Pseudomonadota bacterium]